MKLYRPALLSGLLLVIAGSTWLLLPSEGSIQQRYGHMPKVLDAPPRPAVQYPPYQGPHPADWIRPEDPYRYPIEPGTVGPDQPLYSGPLRYPFACDGEHSGLGQPLVDNHNGYGIPVYKPAAEQDQDQRPIGYSKDCLYPTRIDYLYNRTGTNRFYPLSQAQDDIAQLNLNGQSLDFIVRVESGTINRFIYTITTLKGPEDTPLSPDMRYWNGDLVYQFKGGVGIGFRQGRMRMDDMAERRIDQLRQGYAIASSTGNHTSNHYNIWLAEETALRVKRQFIARYGKPRYTLGIGGSGGAIQQYLIGQNGSHLLDAGVALYAYPDMLTQTIYVFDCELLEYYFDRLARDHWSWPQRQRIEGLNALNNVEDERSWVYELAMLIHGGLPRFPLGTSECVRGWRGLTALVNNPRFIHFSPRFSKRLQKRIDWTYWEDLRHIFGSGADDYALQTWDNVGVQYGLRALRAGEISPATFLHLNANIGGWKPPGEMRDERYWRINGSSLFDFSPWSHHNMQLSPDGGRTPAQRSEASPEAIEAAFRSGLVFSGRLDIPIIDLRHYLEPELDMHHLSSAFSSRLRLRGAGQEQQQLIWVTEKPHAPIDEALRLLTQWLQQGQRPQQADDRCYRRDGSLIASGSGAWDGDWNGKPPGPCMRAYPIYGTSRSQAGEELRGDLFKCKLIDVDNALARGDYAPVDMSAYRDRLKQIFPQGVCDYSQPGIGQTGIGHRGIGKPD
ncbi:hypothetical protein GCM10011352_27870 [Marinobacterium zhoushanense]|uniref:DUF6351 domain-containing protein n=1 Tax=Marinobacterium zhoushanense TaxID=1679163 RepID=A0ABQ1KK32_9GAMM|nr:DUF6351 family protein [Marinobacterium zhoushanense]GGC00075.1 hypothetical protein GCM10011352_27870 [Marinobacterium zhoushanense]